MDISEQDLQAYVDGELASSERARIEAAIAADPVLATKVERERALRARLQSAFDPVLDEPVPARLQAVLLPPPRAGEGRGGGVVDLRPRKPQRSAWQFPVYALAASLLVVAATLWLRPGAAPVRMQDERLVASGALARSLDHALASAPGPASSIAIGISFRAQDGRICRSFAQDHALAGLACRSGDRWAIEVLSATPEGQQGDVRQAASAIPPDVQAAIDTRLQGEPFDAAQERAARERGWR